MSVAVSVGFLPAFGSPASVDSLESSSGLVPPMLRKYSSILGGRFERKKFNLFRSHRWHTRTLCRSVRRPPMGVRHSAVLVPGLVGSFDYWPLECLYRQPAGQMAFLLLLRLLLLLLFLLSYPPLPGEPKVLSLLHRATD